MKINNHQKHKIKAAAFEYHTGKVAPTTKMIREDQLQHSNQICEWEWFCLEHDGLFRAIYKAIGVVL